MTPFRPARALGGSRVLFVEDFDAPPEGDVAVIPPPPPSEIAAVPLFSVADLEAARADAWAAGREAGREAGLAEAAAAESAALRVALGGIAAQMVEVSRSGVEKVEQAAEAIARLLLDVLMVALPATCARYGEAEVRAIMRVVVPPLTQEQAITVRVPPPLAAAVEAEIREFDPELAEKLRVVPTEKLAGSDVRISWEDGFAIRDTRDLWRQIREVLASAGLTVDAGGEEKASA